MATALEYAKISAAAYYSDREVTGWSRGRFKPSGTGFRDAFQGMTFRAGSEVVLAFKGTDPDGTTTKRDLLADFMLGFGMNTSHYTRAAEFVSSTLQQTSRVSLCGHSLGGAIAQVMGNRFRLPFVTFNAPGVALMSRNVGEVVETLRTGTARLRGIGMLASAAIHPVQAYQDSVAFFHTTRGANFRVSGEIVSRVGVHYGRVIEIPSGPADPLRMHSIDHMIAALERSSLRSMRLEQLIG